MDIDIFFSVGTLYTILTYSCKFGLYLIAAFHPSPIFPRLRDPELASKARFSVLHTVFQKNMRPHVR